jgi:aryl-alcohol dehydrogenase-like predicted oxidoreductase
LEKNMQTRMLGKTDLAIVPLVLGGNVFGWTIDESTSFAVLDAFVERGFNCIDTADIYSAWMPGHQGGESETIIGKWFARSGKRKQVVLATKVGMEMKSGTKGLAKKYIMEEVEQSLTRLKTDYIDLYQSHKDDAETPLEETLEAYSRLMEQGKVRAIGASNYSGERLTEAMELAAKSGLPAYATLQPEYNLYDRKGYEEDLAPVAAKFELGVIPYFGLAAGFLTGKDQSVADTQGASRGGKVAKYFDERGVRILKALKAVADERSAAQASVALAWLLAQPTVTAPIASTTSVGQLEALFAAVELRLSERDLAALNEASAY